MLTKIQLLTQNEMPKLLDISLLLYIEFFEENFHGKIYEYKLNNGWIVKLIMDKSRIHHLLGIQHIDLKSINKKTFIDDIKNGTITIDVLRDRKGKKDRFNDMKDRILMFSCLNYLLENCTYFYVDTGKVPKSMVPADFLLFNKISEKGVQLAIEKNKDNEFYKAVSLLVTRAASYDKHIADLDNYQVVELNIFGHNNKLIKNIDYSTEVEKEIAATK